MDEVEGPAQAIVATPRRSVWLFIGTGCLLVTLVAATLAYLGYKAFSGAKADSTVAAGDMLEVLGESWDPDVFWANFSPAAKRASPRSDVERVCAFYSAKIGNLERVESLNFQRIDTRTGVGTVVLFTGVIWCEKGEATYRLALRKHVNGWQLHDFHMNSDVFLDIENSESDDEEAANSDEN